MAHDCGVTECLSTLMYMHTLKSFQAGRKSTCTWREEEVCSLEVTVYYSASIIVAVWSICCMLLCLRHRCAARYTTCL